MVNALAPIWPQPVSCPSHLAGTLAQSLGDQHFREGRFLAAMGLVLGLASLLVDAAVIPEYFALIAAVRIAMTVPLQVLALAMPRSRLGLQKVLIGASLCLFAISLVYASRLAPPAASVAMALGPAIVLGIAVPLLPFSKAQLAGFIVAYIVPVLALMLHIGFAPDLIATIGIALAIVAVGSAVLALRLRRLERRGVLMTLLAEERARELEDSNARLTQLSMQDPLTDLANRRWVETAFARDYSASAEDAPGETALLLLDLDHFKDFNDRWGHDVGDRCLKAVAEVIRHAAVAHCGLAARIGGEEFVILIRAIDRGEATGLAEDIRLGIERIEIPAGASQEPVSCTASIGVAVHEGTQAPVLTNLLKRADEALYDAKRAGRNRYRLAA